MKLCAGGCGQPALPGRKYHCKPGQPGYSACAQKKYRKQDEPKSAAEPQPQPVTMAGITRDEIVDLFEELDRRNEQRFEELRKQQGASSEELPGDVVGLLQRIAENTAFTTNGIETLSLRLEHMQAAPPAPAAKNHDDLLELMDVGQASYDGSSTEKFVKMIFELSGLSEEEARAETARRTEHLHGPRPMDVPQVAAPPEDAFDDLLEGIQIDVD